MWNRETSNEKERDNINRQARPDLLNANALMKKAARNPESIADGGCTYVRMDGRTNRRTNERTDERTDATGWKPRARVGTGMRERWNARKSVPNQPDIGIRWQSELLLNSMYAYSNYEMKNHPNLSLSFSHIKSVFYSCTGTFFLAVAKYQMYIYFTFELRKYTSILV